MQAVRDMVIVEPKYSDRAKQSSRVVLPENRGVQKYYADYWGEVVAVGPDNQNDISVGEEVLYLRHEGKPIKKYKNKEIIALRERWVMGVRTQTQGKVRPTRGRMLAEIVNEEVEKVGSFFMPDTANKEKYPCKGRIISVGGADIAKDTGKEIPLVANPGDIVYYKQFTGVEYEIDGKDCIFLTNDDIVAVENG